MQKLQLRIQVSSSCLLFGLQQRICFAFR